MDVDKMIASIESGGTLSETEFTAILERMSELLYVAPSVYYLTTPITVCGDIHGQLYDLFELLRVSGSPRDVKYLFLGDYVDRGHYSLETFILLCLYQLKYPDHVYLLRGNHECRQVNRLYGFYDQIVNTFGHAGVWRLCNHVFDLLPIAAVIDGTSFCVHGGLSPDVPYVDQINTIDRDDELPTGGPLADLTWSDPDDIPEWGLNQRGAGWLYGRAPVEQFCQMNHLNQIIRAHQLVMAGYQHHFDGKCVTVWSAPNYMYRVGNVASVMKKEADGTDSFVLFEAVPAEKRKIPKEVCAPYFA